MKRFGLILATIVVFTIAGEARGLWVKTMTKADKVEQTHGDEIFYYQNDDVEIMMNWNKRSIMIIPLVAHDWVFLEEGKIQNIFLSKLTVATFDLKNNRTGYWDNIVAMQSLDKSAMVLLEETQILGDNNFPKIWDYLKSSSGSVVFRLMDVNKGFVDYEIETIKTLGYENAINGKHVDGDVDVLGM